LSGNTIVNNLKESSPEQPYGLVQPLGNVSENFVFGKINDLGGIKVERSLDVCHVCGHEYIAYNSQFSYIIPVVIT
jgi:hypothetical protein